MKQNILIISCISLLAFSCTKNFLNKEPVGQVGREQLFETVEGLKAAFNGCYNLMAKNQLGLFGLYGDVRSDNAVLNTSNNAVMMAEYNYQPDEDDDIAATVYIWRDIFEALNNVNNVINGGESLRKIKPDAKNIIDSIAGQAMVLRALCHFQLSLVYAQHYTFTADASHLGVPVLLETPFPGTLVSRKSMKQTYEQILADLNMGIVLMQEHNNSNKVTASVEGARAMLSRVYLYMGNWQGVIEESGKVINSNKFTLTAAENYENMFINTAQKKAGAGRYPEVIWQLIAAEVSSGSVCTYYSDPVNFQVSPSELLRALYATNDVRKSLFKTALNNKWYSNKYGLPAGEASASWAPNYKLFRLAEIYLNRAEAYWHTGQYDLAVADIKLIQGRALNIPAGNVVLNYSSPQQLLEIIKTERRKELAFEGHRIFDIMRNKEPLQRGGGCNAAICSLNYPSNYFILPIPKMELEANNGMQPNPEVNK